MAGKTMRPGNISLRPSMRVGLLGGSFDPPHSGHLRLTRLAITRLGLDQVWWVVTPQNPLKSLAISSLEERIRLCQETIPSGKTRVMCLENQTGAGRTADLLDQLRSWWPHIRFIWLMGADCFAKIDNWHRWRAIMDKTPIAVFDRPGWAIKALTGRAATSYAGFRKHSKFAARLGAKSKQGWIFMEGVVSHSSSAKLRKGS